MKSHQGGNEWSQENLAKPWRGSGVWAEPWLMGVLPQLVVMGECFSWKAPLSPGEGRRGVSAQVWDGAWSEQHMGEHSLGRDWEARLEDRKYLSEKLAVFSVLVDLSSIAQGNRSPTLHKCPSKNAISNCPQEKQLHGKSIPVANQHLQFREPALKRSVWAQTGKLLFVFFVRGWYLPLPSRSHAGAGSPAGSSCSEG